MNVNIRNLGNAEYILLFPGNPDEKLMGGPAVSYKVGTDLALAFQTQLGISPELATDWAQRIPTIPTNLVDLFYPYKMDDDFVFIADSRAALIAFSRGLCQWFFANRKKDFKYIRTLNGLNVTGFSKYVPKFINVKLPEKPTAFAIRGGIWAEFPYDHETIEILGSPIQSGIA